MKGLEAFRYSYSNIYFNEPTCQEEQDLREEIILLVEKELKALEIIKKKKVCVIWLNNGLVAYNNTCAIYNMPKLKQEEYNLLKEVLL